MKDWSLAHRKRGFNIHAFTFVATMILLTVLNLWLGAPYWILWVLLGWGIGLFAHWFFVLGPGTDKGA
jgi:2TM domain